MEATTKDLRLHTRALLAAIDRGERITINYRGKPRAVLTPVTEQSGTAERVGRNPAFGMWADNDTNESVDDHVRRLREPRSLI